MSGRNSQFLEDGYTVIPGALDDELLEGLRGYCEDRLRGEAAEHFDAFRFLGSMLEVDPLDDPTARRLVTNPATLAGLRDLGFEAPRWLSAYLISKPPRSPSLWWHQDWWAWESEVSWERRPAQVFVMYYLRDVGPDDGALRVIPGSHRRRHPLHDVLPPAHGEEINQASEGGPAHAMQPGEVTVSVRAGDAVVGDCRILHSTHPNRSDRRRTCLTLWYLPLYSRLPEEIKAYVVEHPAQPPRGWWREEGDPVPPDLRPLLPTYEGTAEPVAYQRTPPAGWPGRAAPSF